MLDPNNVEDLQSIEKCRSIVNEILRFGVSELEIKKIIGILSLELEDKYANVKTVETEVPND